MFAKTFSYTVTERFLRYVTIDTQSAHTSDDLPVDRKAKGPWPAAREGAARDRHRRRASGSSSVTSTRPCRPIPTNRCRSSAFAPTWTPRPTVSGKDVKPQIVRNYQGGDIALPGDRTQVIRVADNPALKDQIGNDIVTSDGTTLLGADNKAGIAEIMDAVTILTRHPADQAWHTENPVHARRGSRTRRRSRRHEEARRGFRLHHRRRERRQPGG